MRINSTKFIFLFIIFFSSHFKLEGQSIFLDNEDGFYVEYGQASNRLFNSKAASVGFIVYSKYEFEFTYLWPVDSNLKNALSLSFSFILQDKKIPIKSQGSIFLGMGATEGQISVLGGMGFSILFELENNLFFSPEMQGGFSASKIGESTDTHIQIIPVLSLGFSLSHENRISFLYFKPAIGISSEVKSISLEIGILFKLKNRLTRASS